MEIRDQQRLESLEEKKAAQLMQTWCQKDLQLHERRPAGKLTSYEPPIVWIIVDETAFEVSTLNYTGRAKTATTLRLENVTLDTL